MVFLSFSKMLLFYGLIDEKTLFIIYLNFVYLDNQRTFDFLLKFILNLIYWDAFIIDAVLGSYGQDSF
jgi:hypothetical protein